MDAICLEYVYPGTLSLDQGASFHFSVVTSLFVLYTVVNSAQYHLLFPSEN